MLRHHGSPLRSLQFSAASSFLIAGWLLFAHAGPPRFIGGQGFIPPNVQDQSFSEIWYRWDAIHYFSIATKGYEYIPGKQCTAGFMPLLPMIMVACIDIGIDPVIGGVLIANLAFVIGMMFFVRTAYLITGRAVIAWRAGVLLAAFPTALFFSCPYQESFGFLGVAGAMLAIQRNCTGYACLGAAFAALARLTTLALPVALFAQRIQDRLRGPNRYSRVSIIAVSLAAGLMILGWMIYCQMKFGDSFAHFKAHQAWNRKPPNPVNIGRTLLYLFYYFPAAGAYSTALRNGLPMFFFTWLGIKAWRMHGPYLAALILIPILQGALTGIPMSIERIVLASFPAFIVLAEMMRAKIYYLLTLVIFIALQVWLLNGYLHYQFVG